MNVYDQVIDKKITLSDNRENRIDYIRHKDGSFTKESLELKSGNEYKLIEAISIKEEEYLLVQSLPVKHTKI